MKRNRKVFGRLTVQIDGKPVRFEMRQDGIYLRPKHARRVFRALFSEVYDQSLGQMISSLTMPKPRGKYYNGYKSNR